MCSPTDLTVGEAPAQNQAKYGVQDVGPTEDRLQSAHSPHHTEQDQVPLDHRAGLQADPRPQSPVEQVSQVSKETGKYLPKSTRKHLSEATKKTSLTLLRVSEDRETGNH